MKIKIRRKAKMWATTQQQQASLSRSRKGGRSAVGKWILRDHHKKTQNFVRKERKRIGKDSCCRLAMASIHPFVASFLPIQCFYHSHTYNKHVLLLFTMSPSPHQQCLRAFCLRSANGWLADWLVASRVPTSEKKKEKDEKKSIHAWHILLQGNAERTGNRE